MQAELISIGTELLLGDITDTNATTIARSLREIGLDLIYRTTVGDNEERIASVLDIALGRVDVVITSGGLGPTVDDVTREAISRATDRPLMFQQVLFDQIEARFRSFGVKMSKNNRRQAFAPEGATLFENPVGTAPIFALETPRGTIITLPGVPREMEYLLSHVVLPWLKQYVGAPAVIKSVVLRTAGIGESQIDARIGDLMKMTNPTVGLAAHTGQTDIRVTAKAETDAKADVLMQPVNDQLRERLGSFIYGVEDQTIEMVVMDNLSERKETLALVEAGTNGLLHSRLQAVISGDSNPLLHSTKSDTMEEWPTHNTKADTLEDMIRAAAQAVRQAHKATYGLAVVNRHSSPTAPESGLEIAYAIASNAGISSRSAMLARGHTEAAIWATTNALAALRRTIIENTG